MEHCGPGLNSITSRTSGFLPGAPALTRARSNQAKTKSFPGNFPAFAPAVVRCAVQCAPSPPFTQAFIPHPQTARHPASYTHQYASKTYSPRVFMTRVYTLGLRIHRVKCAIIHHLIHQPRTGARDLHIDEEELHALRLNVERRHDARSLLFSPR